MIPDWSDRPVAIVGAGESLRGFNFKVLQDLGCHVLAINGAAYDLPFADAAFSLDVKWVRMHSRRTSDLMPFYVAVPEHVPSQGAIRLRYSQSLDGGLSDDPTRIECGFTSGYGALNLAYLAQARMVVLLGFDYHGGHYCPGRYAHFSPHTNWAKWATHFRTTLVQLRARGTVVINANPDSRVDAFPRVSIEEGLGVLSGGPHRGPDIGQGGRRAEPLEVR